nr:immunoglobulin light chain junction region [Macaca mulatta]
CAMGDSSGDVF